MGYGLLLVKSMMALDTHACHPGANWPWMGLSTVVHGAALQNSGLDQVALERL